VRDMVPRSRLVAVENELEAAEEKNKRVVGAATTEINNLSAEVKRLEEAIDTDLMDAKHNCGKYTEIMEVHCEPYISRGKTCSDCPMHWLHHSESAIETKNGI